MDQAKSAINKIIGRGGQHDTVVDEHVNPAVTQETVKPHRHEETTQAIDREVHQDHYHTTVQPLQHKEVLPEQHTHQQMPVQEREFHHGDHDKIKSSVQAEAAKFADSSTTHQTTHSTSQAPVAAGEHVHHHVHETVQPVIHKETVQPEVVHTTVPIHETHHAQAEHHGLSTLPTKTLGEFQELGGKVTGGTQRHEEYEGHPRPYNPALQASRSDADHQPASHDGLHGSHATSGTQVGGAGLTGPGSQTTGGLGGPPSGHPQGGRLAESGSNVSGTGNSFSTGAGQNLSGTASTGTALGGRHEDNTGARSLDAATTRDNDNRTSTGGLASHHDRGHTDTSTSTRTGTADTSDTTQSARDDVQSPSQGRDPNLVETNTKTGGGLKGEGVDGSHSAVFGLTPDGHKHDDTTHGTTPLRPAHTKKGDNSSTSEDTGSRAPTGAGVADQLNDPRVAEKGHGGSDMPSTSESGKPGAGVGVGGQQGFGTVRGTEHGGTAKVQDKLDPTTDADNDGKRGVLD